MSKRRGNLLLLFLFVEIVSLLQSVAGGELADTDVETLSPSEGILGRLRTGKKYHLNSIVQLNWFQALANCNSLNMKLASIDTETEYEDLVRTIRQAKLSNTVNWWLSGSDLGEEGNYVWMSTGKSFTYTNFRSGEPNHFEKEGKKEHCVELDTYFGYQWNDNICDHKQYHVCEY